MPETIKKEEPKSINKKLVILAASLVLLILLIILFVKSTNKDVNLDVYAPIPEESMETGSVGSINNGNDDFNAEEQIELITQINPEALENPVRTIDLPIPHDIYNTSGTIIGIYANYIVVRGIGTNFDDQIKRDLTVTINEETFIDGIKGDADYFKTSLKVGDEISIEAFSNIHGKAEFAAKYINTIKE